MNEHLVELKKQIAKSRIITSSWSKRDVIFTVAQMHKRREVDVKLSGDKVTFVLGKQKVVANVNDIEFAARRRHFHHFVFKDFFIKFELWA